MFTGTPPDRHGVIANGFYDRDRRAVEFWVAPNQVMAGEPIWDAIRGRRPGFTSAVWHAQNVKGASVDFLVTPAPIHEPDGTTRLWCYSKPDDLYRQLLADLGHFPLQHYWGPLANIESTRWILRAALWLIRRRSPNFHWIYLPHLDYAGQKCGPNSLEARAALRELDGELAGFSEQAASMERGPAVYLVVGEYAMTPVRGVVYPNRLLREAGLLHVVETDGCEYVDLAASAAFAMVDHQFAHVYVSQVEALGQRGPSARVVERVVEVLRSCPGIAGVYSGPDRAGIGLDHPRSGDVILVAEDTHWFAYYWWFDEAQAPPFARTVDIHRKPGYDPVELFFDPATKGIPLNASRVKGSHGVPAVRADHRTALICSSPCAAVQSDGSYRDTDFKRIALSLMGLP
jgi:hypothetical protein